MTLEKLLNILCKKGWKPFGWKDIKRINNEGWFVCFVHKSKKRPWLSDVSHRELVSKESGLWQFVCKNGMVNINYGNIREYYSEQENGGIYLRRLNGEDNYEYWLIESALCDEDELEQFLLENIKIKGKTD